MQNLVSTELDIFFAQSDIKRSPDWTDARTWAVNTIGAALCRCSDDRQSQLVFNSVFKYLHVNNFKLVGKVWTSTFLKMLAAKIMEEKNTTQLAQIQAIFQKSGTGFMFEYAAHRKFCKFKGTRFVYQLGTNVIVRLDMTVKKIVLIRSIDDIATLKIGDYGLPTTSNFSLIDGVMNNILINYTIAEKHTGAVGKLDKIKSKIDEQPRRRQYMNYYLLFVVPSEVVSKFTKINTNAKSIKEYADSFRDVTQCVAPDDAAASENALRQLYQGKGTKRKL